MVTISLLNLVWDFKTKILEFRRGIFNEFHHDEVDIKEGANTPGYIISNAVGGFVVVVLVVTVLVTLLIWPLFWKFLWSIRILLLSIIIPTIVMTILEGWVQDYAYEQYYVKRRWLAGIMDSFYFFLAILQGFGAAVMRFLFALIGLAVSMARINVPCLPA